MQLLAKFKQILYMGFRATLNFRIFKVALPIGGYANATYGVILWVPYVSTVYRYLTTILQPLTDKTQTTIYGELY